MVQTSVSYTHLDVYKRQMRGLTGEHGVMIPVQNVDNLQLSDEIVSAVKKGLFHVYAVSTIEEGIEAVSYTHLDVYKRQV